MISGHTKTENAKPLDRPENFLFEMSKLPQFDERVACIIFQGLGREISDDVITSFLNDVILLFSVHKIATTVA